MKYLIITVFAGLALTSNAQQVSRQLIGSLGGDASAGGMKMDFSAGESAIGIEEGGSFITTIGFHQTESESVSVQEINQDHMITVYPNPTAGLLNIDLNSSDEAMLFILDASGKIVVQDHISGFGTTDLSFLESGVYHVKIVAESFNSIHSIIKQ